MADVDVNPIDVIRRTSEAISGDKTDLRWKTRVTNTDPIPVTISNALPSDEIVVNTFGTASSVASTATATIVSFTVPSGKSFFLNWVEVSGDNIANYTVEISSTEEAKKRTWFGGNLFTEFDFSGDGDRGLSVAAGVTIDVKVENFRPSVGDFEGRILGVQKG